MHVPYPPPRVTYMDLAEVAGAYREHAYSRWFLTFDRRPNCESLQRSLSLPSGALRMSTLKPKKEKRLPPTDPLDQFAVSPVRQRYLGLDSPSRVQAKAMFDGTLDRNACPHLHRWPCRLCYDARLKSFEQQVKGLKSSVGSNDLTRTQRRLKFFPYRQNDKLLDGARRRCQRMELTYQDLQKKLKKAIEEQAVSKASKALHDLEKTVAVDDEFMAEARKQVGAWVQERDELLGEMDEAIAAKTAAPLKAVLDAWPFNREDVGLQSALSFLAAYDKAQSALFEAVKAGEKEVIEKLLAAWAYEQDDRLCLKAKAALEV